MPWVKQRIFAEVRAIEDPDASVAHFPIVPKIQNENVPRLGQLTPENVTSIVGTVDFISVLVATQTAGVTLAEFGIHISTCLLAATLCVGMFERSGGYKLKNLSRPAWQMMHVTVTWVFTAMTLLLIEFVSKTYWHDWALGWMINALVLLLFVRCLVYTAIARGYVTRNIAIVGTEDQCQRLIAKLQNDADKIVNIVGVFDEQLSRIPVSVCGLVRRGTTGDLLQLARNAAVAEIIIALPLDAELRIRSLCEKMKAVAIDVRVSIEPLTNSLDVHRLSYIGTVPLIEVIDRPLKNWRAIAKSVEDKLVGSLLIFLVGPLMILIAILIKLDSSGPIFFAQRRFGFNSEVIPVLKFRTMHVDRADQSGAQRTLKNDPRITGLGRILRRLSLDELPQLINVIRGDMSLIGPRPHAVAMRVGDRLYYEAIDNYLHRHRVKPGITGWAQVNGLRGEVDTLEKARARVAHDLHYIEHWSPWLDLKILLKTLRVIAARENAY